ncbi:MAG TPA: hypothetical protein VFA34_05225 [Actinomycetota bacterium]|jgi:hypothetical protein|nr:hypothetical protein [Actinomycetota bacterium]
MARRKNDLADTAEQDAVGRLDKLGDAVSRIRGGRRIDSDRLQLIAGATLAVLGLVAILLGWYGAANTGIAFEQTPYLISGGLLGVALVFLGGFVYFAYWVTRLVRESRAQSERASEILDQIAESLNGAGPARRSPRPIAGAGNGGFVATAKGNLFHKPDCTVVAGRQRLRRVTASTRGLEPCAICDPLSD